MNVPRIRHSIRTRFILMILATTLFFSAVSLTISYKNLSDYSLQLSEETALLILDSTESRFKGIFQSFESLASALVSMRAVQEVDISAMRDIFINTVLAWKRYVRAIYLGTVEGTMYEWGQGEGFINHIPQLPPDYDARTRPWYQLGINTEGFAVTEPYVYASIAKTGITCVQKVYNNRGVFVGILGIDILLEHLDNILEDLHIPKSGRAFILGANGLVLAGKNFESLMLINDNDYTQNILDAIVKTKNGKFTASFNGSLMHCFYRQSTVFNWILLTGIPSAEITAPVKKLLVFIMLANSILILLQLLAVNTISVKLISAPLKRIVSVINSVENGDKAARVKISSSDEYCVLANELNSLFDTVQEYSVSLEQKVRERTIALKKLQKENTALKVLEERRRIYQDLHDSIGAKLTNIFFSANVARKALEHNPEKIGELIDSIESNCNQAVHSLKTIVHGMVALDTGGFSKALRNDMENRLGKNQIALKFSIKHAARIDNLPFPVRKELLLTFDELISNIQKHALASKVCINILIKNNNLLITVKDDGCGFSPESEKNKGLGISSIHTRVKKLGGSCTLTTAPGCGTRYEIEIPLSEPKMIVIE